MSRFANPRLTGRFVLGPCACEGTPHDEDWMLLRTELGTMELAELGDDPTGKLRLMIAEWNLHDDDGRTAPIDDDHVRRLFADNYEALDAWLKANVKVTALPNAFGAPSRNGSRESASPDSPTILPRP